MGAKSRCKGWWAWLLVLAILGLVVGAVVLAVVKKVKKNSGGDDSAVPGPPGAITQKYSDALKLAVQFFDVQKSGQLVDNKISWRGDSGLKDGSDAKLDLSKGMYDAGDHMKFGFPMAYTATVLSWAILEYGDQMDAVNQLHTAQASLKWITDFLVNAHPKDNVLYVQVGDPKKDHACWYRPEDMTESRPVTQVNISSPGTEVAAETAAAMASASLVFKKSDAKYSDTLLTHAKQLFTFADKNRGSYSESIPEVQQFYNSTGYGDELLWAAAWLYHATGDKEYLDYVTGENGDEFAQFGKPTWFSWDNKLAGTQVLLSRLTFFGGKDTSDNSGLQKYRKTAEAVICGLLPSSPTATKSRTDNGLIWVSEWNALQHPVAAAFLAALYSDYMLTSRSTKLECDGDTYKPSDIRLKREAEEKQRKEEEERRKQEELEREKEAARILKKEREKEKLQRKRQEGKILTAKQKEEQRRREAMRNQILANAGGLPLLTTDNEKKAKRPMYQKKKTKAAPIHANGAASAKPVENLEEGDQQDTIPEPESGEFDKVEDVESLDLEDKSEVAESVKENGVEEEEEEDDDDDDPWDVKSFDDVNLSVKRGFSDEEIDSEPEPVAKKDIKSSGANPSVSAQKTVPSQPIKSQDGEDKKKQPDNDVDKSKKKSVSVKKEAPTSNADPKESGDNLRSPICCIMGHVDTGKTKLLDCIRGTNVQEGEAGGITQQIGATYFPAENIRERTKELKADAKLKVPGLLVIDTPGHESFTNLRSRGSGLCDIAILVVDIMHGLEPQTIESLNLLKMRNTEFIVALNKVDRLYGWKTCRNAPIVKAMKQQSKDVQNEFNMRLVQIITQFKEQGLNTELYYKNKEMGETYSIIPTSAISGEGIPDLLLLLVQWTQKTMVEKLTFSNEIQCTVLEVKVVEGLGTTIDVVLVNGVLHEGDQIVVCGMQGPIVATIRSLLTPHPMKELRVKGAYLHHSEIKAAQGIKIAAQGLEHAIAGTALHVVGPHDDLEDIKETAMEDMKSVLNRIDKTGEGVCVQASTLGSLEALLEFLKTPAVNIPVSGISIGPVHKKDVMKASVMLEKKKEFATILAFDVKVTPEAREMADDLGVKIFIADIIYHLFDQFKAYIDNIKEEKKKESADEAVFPCVLKIMPNCVFNKKDPIILGVDVLDGILKVGTPICIPQRDFISIGRIASIENNHKPVDMAKKGSKLAIKIIGSNSEEQQKMFGRHFEIDDELVSQISRNSIDVLKANYRDELSMEEWKLLVKLKKLFEIP